MVRVGDVAVLELRSMPGAGPNISSRCTITLRDGRKVGVRLGGADIGRFVEFVPHLARQSIDLEPFQEAYRRRYSVMPTREDAEMVLSTLFEPVPSPCWLIWLGDDCTIL